MNELARELTHQARNAPTRSSCSARQMGSALDATTVSPRTDRRPSHSRTLPRGREFCHGGAAGYGAAGGFRASWHRACP